MMTKSPAGHIACSVAWVITALAAINTGLMPFDYNFFESSFIVEKMPWIIEPAYYIIGVAGIMSLVTFVFTFVNGSYCGCKDSSCSCR